MPYTRKSCGDPTVDRVFDDVYRILNRLDSGITGASGPATGTPNISTVTNGSGVSLYMGYLVIVDDANNLSVTAAPEDSYNIIGVVYDSEIPAGADGNIVTSGPADVYFNSNGATRGYYFRMSKSADTGDTDTGKAQSEAITRIDTIRKLGYIMQSHVGSGLTRCMLI